MVRSRSSIHVTGVVSISTTENGNNVDIMMVEVVDVSPTSTHGRDPSTPEGCAPLTHESQRDEMRPTE
ncbi:lysosomal acid phosphatase, putative [Anopheles sinensis]|uniref:Lysosomal acid phosphatase, putative n=1 Tax=Anopheles sinensis TaxID=74873 RepID=A0A084VPZ4_ANOSI|nr:lysosomal acid phosphatase, putative [Anopheles sinensis]